MTVIEEQMGSTRDIGHSPNLSLRAIRILNSLLLVILSHGLPASYIGGSTAFH